ncbi:MAG TPA: GMP synthase [Deltaproteobacteria bacterium]|nr:GMP synthase [Candidatus Binatota bacterium]HIL12649.1 GMP synthase [Deltaproteobacteria bacterium]
MKIGILLTDSVQPALAATHGQYSDMFARLLGGVDPSLQFACWDVHRGEFPDSIDDCDGYLMTGGRHSVYDELEWIAPLESYVVRLAEASWPLFAVCFGHQLVARALGGRTELAEQGWTLGVHSTRIESPFPWAVAGGDSVAGTHGELRLIHSHRDQVTRLPDGASLVGSSDSCPVSMYRIGKHVMSCQGHPEFSPEYALGLYESRRGLYADDLWNRSLASLAEDTDGGVIARWAVEFFRDAADSD